MGWSDSDDPNDGPSRSSPRKRTLYKRLVGGTSKEIDYNERPFCIHKRIVPRQEMMMMSDDESDGEMRLVKLKEKDRRNAPRCGTPRVLQEEADKDERKNYPSGRVSPPMLTRKINEFVDLMPIGVLWKEGFKRPKRMVIFIRGPPYCGKAYLSKRIEDREKKFNHPDYKDKICVISGFDSDGKPRQSEVDSKLKRAIYDDMKLIIIELKFLREENYLYRNCVKKAKDAKYKIFGIELFVDTDNQYFLNHPSAKESQYSFQRAVKDYMKKMEKYPPDPDVILLDPLEVYDSDYKIQFILANQSEKPTFKPTNICDDDRECIREFIKRVAEDPKTLATLPNGLEWSINFDYEIVEILADLIHDFDKNFTKSTTELYLNEIYDFKPNNVVNYDHKHMRTFDEEVSEFKVKKVYDHGHKKSNFSLDFDFEEIYEKEKLIKKEAKKSWYLKTAKGPEEIESNPNYPNNWKRIEVDREMPAGKRKKEKNAKIKKVLDTLTVNTVRKRVKRLKIDDQTPMIIEEPQNPAKVHINQLLNFTTLSNVDDDTKVEYLEYIKSFYERLDEIPEMFFILRLIVLANKLEIIFYFNGNFPPAFCNANKIFIDVRSLDEREIISSLAHQMMHVAMMMTYNNEGKPYRVNDEDRRDEIERILFAIECMEKNHKIILQMLREDESRWHFEVLGCCMEILAMGEKENLKENYKNLFEFYERSLREVEKFFKQFDDCSRMSCF